MGESTCSEFLNDNAFRCKGRYKFHVAVDETENLYFVANNKLIYSSTDVIVGVEMITWVFNMRSNDWSKRIFYGHESLALGYLLCVREGKIYMFCTDLNSHSPDSRSDYSIVSVDTKDRYLVTVVKKIPYSQCDFDNNKLYFVNRENKVSYLCLEPREERRRRRVRNETDLSCTRFLVSNGKIFTHTGVCDLATGKFISRPKKLNHRKHSYVCKTKYWLCFTAENDFDHLYLLHAIDLRWIRLHLPLKRILKRCCVCFSPRSSRMYFVYFNSDSAPMFNAKVVFFSIPDEFDDWSTSLIRFEKLNKISSSGESKKKGTYSKLNQCSKYFLRSMV